MKLWIDDIRPAPGNKWNVAQTSQEAIDFLDAWRGQSPTSRFFEASFDHDLGGDDTSRRVLTWMIENDVWPDVIRFHTANPVGRQWLVGTARRYAPGWVDVQVY